MLVMRRQASKSILSAASSFAVIMVSTLEGPSLATPRSEFNSARCPFFSRVDVESASPVSLAGHSTSEIPSCLLGKSELPFRNSRQHPPPPPSSRRRVEQLPTLIFGVTLLPK